MTLLSARVLAGPDPELPEARFEPNKLAIDAAETTGWQLALETVVSDLVWANLRLENKMLRADQLRPDLKGRVLLEAPSNEAYGDSELAEIGRALALRLAADRQRPTGIVARPRRGILQP